MKVNRYSWIFIVLRNWRQNELKYERFPYRAFWPQISDSVLSDNSFVASHFITNFLDQTAIFYAKIGQKVEK